MDVTIRTTNGRGSKAAPGKPAKAAPKTTAKPAPTETKWRRPGSGVLCLVLLGLTLGAVGHVAVHARKFEIGRALGLERKVQLELAAEKRHLEIEISRLKNRELIMRVAREKLKMAPPDPANIRVITGAGEVKAPPPPVPAGSALAPGGRT